MGRWSSKSLGVTMTDDLGLLDATAQAELVRSGELSPTELVAAAIARAEKIQPQINALTTERFDRARDEAASLELPDGPFRGVPFLFKDLACGYEGEPCYDGMSVLKDADFRLPQDTVLASRFRAAGLVTIGRTNTPELGIMPTTEPLSYGPTRNPWDPTRTPGGSSGGSAAAVAAGMTPFAHASDGGGSIRIPAACCGLVGLKTSRGRISVAPSGDLARPLSVQFAVTRSVRDCAALLDAVAGSEPSDMVHAPAPLRPYREEVGANPGRLRIGLCTTIPTTGEPVDAECVAATELGAKLLEQAGHTVEFAHPSVLEDGGISATFLAMWNGMAASNVARAGRLLGRELVEADVEPLTWFLAQSGGKTSAVELMDAQFAIQTVSRRLAAWWDVDGWDLLLTPTIGSPPPKLGVLMTPDEPLKGFARGAGFVPFTPIFNVSGQPAISIPIGTTASGVPIGIHIAAAWGREDLLIAVAAQLETAAPWSERRPQIHG